MKISAKSVLECKSWAVILQAGMLGQSELLTVFPPILRASLAHGAVLIQRWTQKVPANIRPKSQ